MTNMGKELYGSRADYYPSTQNTLPDIAISWPLRSPTVLATFREDKSSCASQERTYFSMQLIVKSKLLLVVSFTYVDQSLVVVNVFIYNLLFFIALFKYVCNRGRSHGNISEGNIFRVGLH